MRKFALTLLLLLFYVTSYAGDKAMKFPSGTPLEVAGEAPSDGNTYGRKNKGWVSVSTTSGVTDHAGLTSLDYTSSGHTGFLPSANPSITGTVSVNTTNLVINSSGNVGIGTDIPTSKLHVHGELKLGTNAGAVILSGTNASSTVTYQLPATDGTSGQVLKTDGAANLSWTSASSMTYPGSGIASSSGTSWNTSITTSSGLAGAISDETGTGSVVFSANPSITGTISVNRTNFAINTNGNIGIGIASPVQKLQVNGVAMLASTTHYATNGIWDRSGRVGVGVTPAVGTQMAVNGNLGIGTDTAIKRLDVRGGAVNIQATDSQTGFNVAATTGSIGIGAAAGTGFVNVGGTLNVGSTAILPSGKWDSNGNVGIGTDTPTAKLQVQGKGTFTGATNLSSTNVNIGVGSGETDTGLYANNTNEMQVVTGGIVRLHVSSDGSIKIMGTIPVGAVLCVGTNNQLSWAGGTISAGGTAGVMTKITSQ